MPTPSTGFIFGLCIVVSCYIAAIVLFVYAVNEHDIIHTPGNKLRLFTFASVCAVIAIGFLIFLLVRYQQFLPPSDLLSTRPTSTSSDHYPDLSIRQQSNQTGF